MFEPIQYPYSLKFSFGTLLLMIVFMLFILNSTLKADVTLGWVIFGFFAVGFLFLFGLVLARRLLPALRGQIALELDHEGINDYIRDVSINWRDIRDIKLARGRSTSVLYINLKWESEYGSQMAIPLRWIKGNDAKIYEEVLTFFEKADVLE